MDTGVERIRRDSFEGVLLLEHQLFRGLEVNRFKLKDSRGEGSVGPQETDSIIHNYFLCPRTRGLQAKVKLQGVPDAVALFAQLELRDLDR